jgi:uncharacterized membrane protein YphA (DoxX/SURF4 family)
VSGALKIGELTSSVRAVKAYRLFGPEVAEFVGYVQPPLLMVVGTLLILGLFTRIAAIVAALVMVAFIIGIASVWARGLNIDCGCFSAGGDREGAINYYEYGREIFRDVILLGVAAWLAVRPASAWSVDELLRPRRGVDDTAMTDDVPPGDGASTLTSTPR